MFVAVICHHVSINLLDGQIALGSTGCDRAMRYWLLTSSLFPCDNVAIRCRIAFNFFGGSMCNPKIFTGTYWLHNWVQRELIIMIFNNAHSMLDGVHRLLHANCDMISMDVPNTRAWSTINIEIMYIQCCVQDPNSLLNSTKNHQFNSFGDHFRSPSFLSYWEPMWKRGEFIRR